MNIRFKFDGTLQDNLTWDDMEVLESGRMGAAKNVLARFVVDDAEKPVPFETAKKNLGALKLRDIQGVLEQFTKLISESAINPTNAA